MLLDEASEWHGPFFRNGDVVTTGMHNDEGFHAAVNERLTPALVNDGVQATNIMQRGCLDLGLVTEREPLHRGIKARVRDRETQRPLAVGLAQRTHPIPLGPLRCLPPGLEGRGNDARYGAALAEAADGIHAAGLADGAGDGGHALVEEAVRARGVVLAPPRPRVGRRQRFASLTVAGGGRLVAGDVAGEQAVRARGVDEGGEKGRGGEGLDEELLEGAGLGVEEGPGLCVAWVCER